MTHNSDHFTSDSGRQRHPQLLKLSFIAQHLFNYSLCSLSKTSQWLPQFFFVLERAAFIPLSEDLIP